MRFGTVKLTQFIPTPDTEQVKRCNLDGKPGKLSVCVVSIRIGPGGVAVFLIPGQCLSPCF